MTALDEVTQDLPDDAAEVVWDLETLVPGGGSHVDDLLDQADAMVAGIVAFRARVAELDAGELADLMQQLADLQDVLGRAGSYAGLRFASDSVDPAIGALMQRVDERSTAIGTQLLFVELEWAAVPDDRVAELLADDRLAFCRHHLDSARRYRPHLLSEPEERIDTEKDQTGRSAWVRLFTELSSAIEVDLGEPGAPKVSSLEQALSLLGSPDRSVRQHAAAAVTAGLAPGLRTRAFVFNTLLLDRSIQDRLRQYPSWITSRNLANEASDESVEALVAAVRHRYDIPQRWYRLKADILGVERLADYDRMASVTDADPRIGWAEAKALVLDAYASFSPELATTARRFFDERWIDAPVRPGKRPGAFCAYTVPSHHPYVLLNWTHRQRDVLTLAHELGHGLHAYLAREQGAYHQGTPLTLAETASVFGETVTFGNLLDRTDDPDDRLGLLAGSIEGAIGTVFRQTAMNRFEHLVHTERRGVGELSVERFNELWAESQHELLGDAVEVTEGYRTWWSYIPHFIATPGYVYAYAYGQLLAMSVYARYQEQGSDFVPRYLHLLSAGGSLAPEDLGKIVGCDLGDPGFWDGGLDLVEDQLQLAEAAAHAAGRISS